MFKSWVTSCRKWFSNNENCVKLQNNGYCGRKLWTSGPSVDIRNAVQLNSSTKTNKFFPEQQMFPSLITLMLNNNYAHLRRVSDINSRVAAEVGWTRRKWRAERLKHQHMSLGIAATTLYWSLEEIAEYRSRCLFLENTCFKVACVNSVCLSRYILASSARGIQRWFWISLCALKLRSRPSDLSW